MPCLLDTSAIIYLIKSGLLADALQYLEVPLAEVEILPEAYHKAENNSDRGRPIFTPPQRQACLDFCNTVGRIKSVDKHEHILLTKKHEVFDGWHRVKVDGGEAVLFAYTQKLKEFSILTADWKCLVALAKWPGCEHIHHRIVGRVFCMERLIRGLIQTMGFRYVSPKICLGYHSIDDAIKTGEDGCCDVLYRREMAIQKSCNGLLKM